MSLPKLTLGLLGIAGTAWTSPTTMLDFKVGMKWVYQEEQYCFGMNCGLTGYPPGISPESPRLTRTFVRVTTVVTAADTTILTFSVLDSVTYPNRPVNPLAAFDSSYTATCKASAGRIACPTPRLFFLLFPFTAVDEEKFINRNLGNPSSIESSEERLLNGYPDTLYYLSKRGGVSRSSFIQDMIFKKNVGVVTSRLQINSLSVTETQMVSLVRFQNEAFDHAKFLPTFVDQYKQVGLRAQGKGTVGRYPRVHRVGFRSAVESGDRLFLLDGRSGIPLISKP